MEPAILRTNLRSQCVYYSAVLITTSLIVTVVLLGTIRSKLGRDIESNSQCSSYSSRSHDNLIVEAKIVNNKK